MTDSELLVMRERKRNYRSMITLIVITIFLVTGCFSGGGGSDGGTDSQPNNSFATTQGTAAKGIIANGVITASELNANGQIVQTLGTTTTDKEGKYSLPINGNYKNGPVLVTVTSSADGKTTMVCDISDGCGSGVNFRDTLILDDAFEMITILPSLSKGASVDAYITPFTHMAARRALNGEVNDDNVNRAISEINKVVGVDIRETAPIDITKTTSTSSSESLVYSAFLAAAGKLAVSDSAGLAMGLDKFADTFSDGKFDASDGITIDAILNAVEAEAEANEAINTTELQDQIFAIEAQIDNGEFDPESSDTASLTPLQQAKALVSDTRTWIGSIAELEDPVQAFAIDIDEAAKVLDANSVALAEVAANVITSVAEKLESEHNTNNTLELGTYTVDVQDSQGQTVGEVDAVLSDNNGEGLKFTITKKSGLSDAVVNLVVVTNIPKTALSGGAFNLELAKLLVRGSVANDKASIKLNEAKLDVDFKSIVNVDPNGDAPEVNIDKASLSGEITIEANDVTFKGNAGLSFVALNDDTPKRQNTESLRKAEINGQFTTTNGKSFSAGAKLIINNAATFDTFAFFDHQPLLLVWGSAAGDLFGAEEWAREQNANMPIFGGVEFRQNKTCYNWQMVFGGDSTIACVPGDPLGVGAYIKNQYPTAKQLSDIYYSYHTDSNTYYGGLVNFGDFETANNYANATLSVSVDLELQGYPGTRAVATVDRNALRGGDIRLSLVRKGLVLTFTASISETNPLTGTLTVTNTDGAKMLLTASDGTLKGKLSVKGNTMGTIEQSNGELLLVRYKDGSFETL